MLFNSVEFLFFFLVVYALFWQIPNQYKKYWLLVSSLVFYGFWDIIFLFHFFGVVVISFLFIQAILRYRKKILLTLAVSLNLLNLFFFKYTASFLTILGKNFGITEALDIKQKLGIILPLAISFYTFQIIAFIVDVWRGEIKKVSFIQFTVFIMFFPQLIAGPIMRHRDFLYQMDSPEESPSNITTGLYLIASGIIKKVLIADEIAHIIDPFWISPVKYDSLSAAAAIVGFAIQVYGDFSGYTDFARGLARLLGYRIPENFKSPYLSTSFAELWKRWHITLSTWLRDYLYIPLGGSRVSNFKLYLNIIIVMSLGGLWHGNTYTFFLWGLMHGVLLLIERIVSGDKPPKTKIGFILRNMHIMFWWLVGAVFFRSADLTIVSGFYKSILGLGGGAEINNVVYVFQLSFIGILIQVVKKYRGYFQDYLIRYEKIIIPVFSVILFFMIVRIERPAAEFIYFRF